jgi:antitoxin (DNA-binding transcriptional repressor) of toxin-antitoxin stability system
MKRMSVRLFGKHCLAVIDEAQAKRETIVITKRGKPIAKLVPLGKETDDIFGFFVGKGAITGNVISPALSVEEWGDF